MNRLKKKDDKGRQLGRYLGMITFLIVGFKFILYISFWIAEIGKRCCDNKKYRI